MIKHRIKTWAVGKWSFRAIQLIWQKTWVEILAKNVWVEILAENVWVQSLPENVWVEIMARQITFPGDGFLDESITDYQYHKPYKHQCIHHTMFANTTKLQYVFVSWTLRSLAKNKTLLRWTLDTLPGLESVHSFYSPCNMPTSTTSIYMNIQSFERIDLHILNCTILQPISYLSYRQALPYSSPVYSCCKIICKNHKQKLHLPLSTVLWVIAKLFIQNYKNYLPLIDWKKGCMIGQC